MSRLAPVREWPKHFYQGFNRQYFRKVLAIDRQNLIAYWPQWEGAGLVSYDLSGQANHGVYVGVTFGQDGIGDGRSCPLFDGVNDVNKIHSAGLTADFDGQEGSLSLWFKAANVAVWTDGSNDYIIKLEVAGSQDFIRIYKSSSNNQLSLRTKADGTAKNLDKTSYNPTDWVHLALTWSLSADAMKWYLDGVQTGATLTGLGTWSGDLTAGGTFIGASSAAPGSPYNGWLAHPALFTTPLTQAQITLLSTRW